MSVRICGSPRDGKIADCDQPGSKAPGIETQAGTVLPLNDLPAKQFNPFRLHPARFGDAEVRRRLKLPTALDAILVRATTGSSSGFRLSSAVGFFYSLPCLAPLFAVLLGADQFAGYGAMR
jgi:hypothetical protein